ncbi:MAG: class I SAM-dependent RNA methyltransferase [Thermodesulfobacteriota bacterium]
MDSRVRLTVEKMAAGGLGLARWEGRAVLLPGVLPGEEVWAEVGRVKPDLAWAEVLEVARPSPDRREPACPLYGRCGGCRLMHATYQVQPNLKAGPVFESLGRKGEIKPSPWSLFYRDRVRLQAARLGGRLTLGFHAPGSRRLVPVGFCFQLHPRLNLRLPALAEWAGRMSDFENAPTGFNVLVGRLDEGLAITVELPGPPSPGLTRTILEGPAAPEPAGILFQVRERPFRTGTRLEDNRRPTILELDDPPLRLRAGPGVFTQVNGSVNEMMVRDAVALAREMKPAAVLDLYAGLGNFALALAPAAGRVVAVEENPVSVEAARRNARENGMVNVVLVRGDAGRALREMAGRGERFDLVVLDPPRAGAKGLGPHLARLGAKTILYFSCHPAAMARDLAELRSFGYTPAGLTAYDMFPQTAHLEVAARLERS